MKLGKNHKAPKRAWRAFAVAFVLAIVVAIGAPIAFAGNAADGSSGSANPLASLLSAPAADAAPSDGEAGDADDTPYEPNQVIVTIPEGASLEEVEDSLTSLDYVATEELTEENVVDNYVLLELADDVDVDWAQNELASEDVVETTQPNFVYQLFVDDPYATDDTKEQFGALNAVHAFEAWEEATCGNTVGIAILDTGADLDHEDLADNIIQEAGYNAQNPLQSADDDNGHGTHVTGIAAAVADNGKGIAGYSYNASIIPIKALSSTGGGTTMDVLRALSYVNTCLDEHPEYNIRVLNMSFGNHLDELEVADVATIKQMELLNDKGVLVVAAAGNRISGKNPAIPPYRCWPGDYSDSILNVMNAESSERVGNIDTWQTYALYSTSNYNEARSTTKDIVAPGTHIVSTLYTGGYGKKTGTSMASPCVAGVAALVFAANPSLTPGEVNDIICSTATDMGTAGFDDKTGYGLINAEAAVKMAKAGVSIGGESSILQGSTSALTLSGMEGATWESSAPDVAAVADGQVTGVGEGYAIITATGADGMKLSHSIGVYNPVISGVDTLEVGNTTTFSFATTMPGAWTWESSNPAVATIDSEGAVTAVAPGTTTISVGLAGLPGVKAEVQLTVTTSPVVSYRAGIEGDSDWQEWASNGEMAGSTGKSLKLEGLQVDVDLPCEGDVVYEAQLQSEGWKQGEVSSGATAGYSPQDSKGLRVEAVKIHLTGEAAERYDIWYHLHTQRFGWMGWAKNGEPAGTVGYSFRVEAIEIVLTSKGSDAPTIGSSVATEEADMLSFVRCRSYDNATWQGAKGEGDVSGTRKQSKTQVRVGLASSSLSAAGIDRGNSYVQLRVYQDGEWSAWSDVDDAEVGDKKGGAIRGIQARIAPGTTLDNQYNLYYRAEVKDGDAACWLAWACYSDPDPLRRIAGQSNLNLEQLEFSLVPKDEPAPPTNANELQGTSTHAKQRWVIERWPCNWPKPAYKF